MDIYEHNIQNILYIEREREKKNGIRCQTTYHLEKNIYVCVLFFVFAKILQAGYSTKWQPHLKRDETGVQNLCLQGFS